MGGLSRCLTGRLHGAPKAGIAVCVAVVASLSIAGAAVAAPLRSDTVLPRLPSSTGTVGSDVELSNSQLRETVALLRDGKKAPSGVKVRNGRVIVEILTELPQADARALVEDAGGTVLGSVPGELVEALIPFGRLVSLERRSDVEYLRPPLRVNAPLDLPQPAAAATEVTGASTPIVGEEVAKTNASGWQAASWTGADVKVGIVDFFQQTAWNNAATAGEIPATPAGTFCQYNGAACNVFTSFAGAATLHGEGVAEVIHEQAPDAKLYLATVNTVSDLQAAVNYFASQGVKIVSRSLGSELDGPGDGTGPVDTVVNSAIASGMAWFNAAGNNAGPSHNGGTLGSYWRGSWSDPNGNNFLNFTPTDEGLGVICGAFVNGFRWSDWGPAANRTNYNVHILDTPSSPSFMASFTANQQTGANPVEIPQYPCNNADPVDLLVVQLVAAGSGTAGDVLEYMQNGLGIEYWSNPFSATLPAADSASVGEVTIGAIDPPNGTTIGAYSSWGPTNDNRTKPELTAAASVQNFTYGTFPGTSAATPAAAGAAALVVEAGLATTPAQLRTYLLNSAAVDRGAAGTDNTYGWGELVLPAAPQIPGYPRPRGATPMRVSFVPWYLPCTSPNRTHGAPLAFPSCSPPSSNSPYLTVGTPDANGAPANSIGSALFRVQAGAVGPPEDSDVNVTINVTDIRCRPASGVTACGSANTTGGSDYTGQVYLVHHVRQTDRANALAGGSAFKYPGTVQDYDLVGAIGAPCSQTAGTTIGSACSVNTSFNAVLPGSVLDNKRTVLELSYVSMADGGVNGNTPSFYFLDQGVFVP
jgi:hypothetical protein